MKYPKPSLLILYGSLSTLLFGFMCTLFVHFFISEVESYLFFIIPFLGAVFVFVIFNFFLKKFIQHRLAILYRSVQTKQENINLPYLDESLDEMIENAEEKVEQWRKFQTKEILKLKEQEAFRREFLGNLAHELKTPIFSIQGYILTLLEGGLEDDNINKKFLETKIKYYGFLTLLFFPFYKNPENSKIFKLLASLDQLLFKLKFFRLFSWSVLIVAKKRGV